MKLVYIKAAGQFLFLFLSNAILLLLGLLLAPVGILFAVKDTSVSDGREILNFPRWLHLWGNDYDGLLGDKRGWWAANTPYGVKHDSFIGKYLWCAIRNPVNNMRMYSLWQAPITGSTITYEGNYVVEDDIEHTGWQFVTTKQANKTWYGLYVVRPWNTTHAFVMRLGFKIKPSHQGTVDNPKGNVTKISFWKEL